MWQHRHRSAELRGINLTPQNQMQYIIDQREATNQFWLLSNRQFKHGKGPISTVSPLLTTVWIWRSQPCAVLELTDVSSRQFPPGDCPAMWCDCVVVDWTATAALGSVTSASSGGEMSVKRVRTSKLRTFSHALPSLSEQTQLPTASHRDCSSCRELNSHSGFLISCGSYSSFGDLGLNLLKVSLIG